jgi:ATP-dependent Clp protease adaptor protein ClpS
MTIVDAISKARVEIRSDITEPPKYRVIYVNDNTTTMEFVVETLVTIFHYDDAAAEEVTMKIHTDGSAVVAVLAYEIAEQKGVEVTLLARKHGFPLQVKLEPDT